jgi:ATP:corrinoid adenosyltransferase
MTEPLEGAPDLAAAAAAAADPLPPQQLKQQQEQQQEQQQQQQQQQQHGAIEIVVGPMFAGKTTELLRRVQRYEAAGLSVAVVKSSKDDRYSAAHVVTHDGLQRVSGYGYECRWGWRR